ncbi:transmembrane protein 106C isoform 3 [Mus musculus]|uniref:transmembrane protein 106C isoform 3 n=1 Tax=Mus musculus TaxID=10090 RepID=UPI0001549BD2|nr:transmembrane protein 106C isoform 3 [Mus musculus]EDL04214.1 transmembrane protein 106C, isoform CRA_a [Mus musculus]
MGSQHSSALTFCQRKKDDNPEDLLADRDQEEAIAQFPYVEFTGRNSITCHTCQGAGYIPAEQVNELVALIPHSDQRLRPQRTKQYVLLSVLLCLLASGLVFFFLFPHSVLVDDNGIKVTKVTFNEQDSLVVLDVTATLKIRNSNFYPVAVTNLFSQVQYMKAVVGSYTTTNVSLIAPRSEHLLLLHTPCHPGTQHCDLHEDFCEDFIHWPHIPEHLGDTALCGLWGEFHSCSEPVLGSSGATPVEGSLTSVPMAGPFTTWYK